MSFVITSPEMLATASAQLAGIGSAISEANAAAAAPITGVLAAGADEVSAAIAAMFTAHGQAYQAISAQAEAFHNQFVQTVAANAAAYASTEVANVEQTLLNAVNAPSQALTGRALIGNGVNGTSPGQAGGNGGWLWGNGGDGATVTAGQTINGSVREWVRSRQSVAIAASATVAAGLPIGGAIAS
ncbi:PE family protein, partial [Mycobacterium kansasii]|uniref:PE family protein n=1 Tax=Mycobacterium kansasii TaxID=1768 RepID=UPI000CDD6593